MKSSRPNARLASVSLLLLGCGAKDIGAAPFSGETLTVPPLQAAAALGAACDSDDVCAVEDLCAPRACVNSVCVEFARTKCDDSDPCTADACVPKTGECEFQTLTEDADGDGLLALRHGVFGLAECETDCDDSQAQVGMGMPELCDGLDNNCDGVIDEGYSYAPSGLAPVLVSQNSPRAALGGLAFNGTDYVVSLAEALDHNQTELIGINSAGVQAFNEPVAKTNSDSYPGPLLTFGGGLISTWEDRRDDDFEIYFNRFDGKGQKFGPDVRVSNAFGFSLGANVLPTESGFLVTWADSRAEQDDFRIFGQRITFDSTLEGANVNLTPDLSHCESASLAQGPDNTFGLVFNSDQFALSIYFRTVSAALDTVGALTYIAEGVSPSVMYVGGQYYLFWNQYGVVPGDAVWGAILDIQGNFVMAPRRVTSAAPYTRGHTELNLGDRIVLAWSEYHGQNYDVWEQIYDLELNPLTPAFQVTETNGDSLGAQLAFGSSGELGVAYSRHTEGNVEVWLTSLQCQ